MMISIPPKYAVSQVVGYIKGKSAIHLAREGGGKSPPFPIWVRLGNGPRGPDQVGFSARDKAAPPKSGQRP
jgi:hypothetical protein